jgi:hypothetical protein
MLVLFLHVAPAAAQASRTWVSGVGDDTSPVCSRTAPCKTFAAAFALTTTGGEINCTDPGGFGTLTITKSVSIVCDYTDGGVLGGGVNGVTIDAPAGSIVTLKGLDFECAGNGSGIAIANVGVTVHIHKVQIRNCRGGSSNSGIVVGNTSGLAIVFVADSYITDNGSVTSDAGILIRPQSGASALVSVTRTHLERNTNGIFADGSGGGGVSNFTVKDSVISASTNSGAVVASSGASFKGLVEDSMINFNANTGAAVGGAGATLVLGRNTIANNITGVINLGGTLQSFKNNQVALNNTDGTPITAVPGSSGTLQ